MSVGQYVYNVALGGDPEWSLSERMGQAIREDRCVGCYWICRALALINRRHCERVYDADKSYAERLWPASVAFGVGVTALVVLALSLAACSSLPEPQDCVYRSQAACETREDRSEAP